MILYHGSKAKDKILKHGFEIGPSRHTEANEDGVYFSDTVELAERHGYVVKVSVPDEYVELYQENPLSPGESGYTPGDEYIVYRENLHHIEIID